VNPSYTTDTAANYCDKYVSLSVCLSVCSRISKTTPANFAKFYLFYIARWFPTHVRACWLEVRWNQHLRQWETVD